MDGDGSNGQNTQPANDGTIATPSAITQPPAAGDNGAAVSPDNGNQAIDPASVVSPPDLMINNQSVQKIDGVDGRVHEGMDDEQQEDQEHQSQVQQYF